MKILKIVLYIGVVAFLAILGLYAFMYYLQSKETLQVNKFRMYLTVSDYIGFNVGRDAIYFGAVQPGGTSSRTLHIKNNFNVPSKVYLEKYGAHRNTLLLRNALHFWYPSGDFWRPSGALADWAEFSDNGFIMQPGESKNISVTVKVPDDAKFGNYTGKVKVIFKMVR